MSIPALKRDAKAPRAKEDAIFARLDKALQRIPKGTFKSVGGAFGSNFGTVGKKIGKLAGAGLSAITGYGDYKVSQNSLTTVSGTVASMDMVPQFARGDHSIRVRHREFVKECTVPNNPTAFDNDSWLINPGNKSLFPWLSQMSRQYQQYKIHGMVVIFKSMTSDYAANGPLGTVMIATNYNSVERDYKDKIELENSEFAVSTKPSNNLVHAIECDPKTTGLDILYIRDTSYDSSVVSDGRFYDFAKLQFATQGLSGTAGATLGEMWISYDIELIKPIIGSVTIAGISVVSNADGSEKVSSGAGTKRVFITGTNTAPAASTTYSLCPPGAYTLTGDAGIISPPAYPGTSAIDFAPSTGTITFRKNGLYRLWFWATESTTATGYCLARVDAAGVAVVNGQVVNPTATRVGNAQYNGSTSTLAPTADAFKPFGQPIVTGNSSGGAPAFAGFQYQICYTYDVSGIFSTNDYVKLEAFTFPTNSSNLIPTWTRKIAIEWTAYGRNEQAEQFSPYGINTTGV